VAARPVRSLCARKLGVDSSPVVENRRRRAAVHVEDLEGDGPGLGRRLERIRLVLDHVRALARSDGAGLAL